MTRLYSNLKFLRFRDRLDALEKKGVAAPVHVRIKPINLCNHNCWYCAYRADNLQLGEDMKPDDRIPTNKLLEIADDLVSMGVRAVTFSGGGEPLLYKELPAVVRRLAEGNIRVATLTNGSNLKGAMADAFAEYGTWVRVSLDGWDDLSYAAARGAPEGAFSRLMDNLSRFAARGCACVLGVSFIVGEANHTHLADVCARLKDVGANHVKISGAVVSNSRDENNAYHRRLSDAVRVQIEQARRLENSRFTIIDHYHELEERFEKGYSTCPFMMFLTVIGADSRVYSCQDKAYTDLGLLGSIANQRFRDFWFSDANRNRLYTLDPSHDCRHHCVAHQKNLVLHEHLSLDPEHGCFV